MSQHPRVDMDDDKLALAVAHVAFPDGELFTFPDLEPHGDDGDGADTAGYLAACDDWLLFADDEYDVLRLTSPLTGETVLLPGLIDGVRVRDNPVVVANEPPPSGTAPRRWRRGEEMAVLKLVVCHGGGGDLVAAIVGREHFAKVALCNILEGGFSWSISAGDRWRSYDDMAFHGGRLYALTQAEDLLAFDVGYDAGGGEPVVTRVERVVAAPALDDDDEDARMHYLVTSLGGALLMVRRDMSDAGTTDGFVVFEADLAASRWVGVDRLDAGGEALFVGRLCSRAVRAPHDGDHIFFLNDADGLSFWSEAQPRQPYQVAAYDMAWRTFSTLMWRKKPLEDGGTPVTWLFPDDDDDGDVVRK